MNAKITQEKIERLLPNEIFVFGSNTAGRHGAGAALMAINKFGAEYGVGEGLQGKSYAIPTLDNNLNKLSIQSIQGAINRFEMIVKQRTDLHFHITSIGTGLAGFTIYEMAILFAGFQNYENVSLPQIFIDVIGTQVVYGYKAVNVEFNEVGEIVRMHCRGFDYECGEVYGYGGPINICSNGFHFCENIIDTLEYYSRNDDVKYVKVLGCGEIQFEGNKHCVSILKIIDKYETSDKTWNSGDQNSGNRNSGHWNSGHQNSGHWNSGHRNSGNQNSGDQNSGNRNSGDQNSGHWNSGDQNSGNRNSGDQNSGNRNSGDQNSGNRNSGHWNSGHQNSGNRNSGDQNSGHWNSGHQNSGHWNSGHQNSGYFNTDIPPLRIFNKETTKSHSEIYFPNWLNFELIEWVNSNNLSDDQKLNHPYWEVCGGALITSSYKDAAQKSYNNATTEEQRSIEDVPNYDADILFEIFGIDRRIKK